MDVLNLTLVILLAFSVALINALNTIIENARRASKERHRFDIQKIAQIATSNTNRHKDIQDAIDRFIDRYYSYTQVDLLRSIRALEITILILAFGFLIVSFNYRGYLQQNISNVANELSVLQANQAQIAVAQKYLTSSKDPFFYSSLGLVLLLVLLSLTTFLLFDVTTDLKELIRPSIIKKIRKRKGDEGIEEEGVNMDEN